MSGQPQPGDLVGHYRIDGVLGVGGMGMVFSATDLRLNRQVAVKVMLAHVATSPTFLGRFQREASILARLDSPHVISIYDHGEQDGWPYLVTQHAAGGDLGLLLREGGPLPPPLAFRVCAQVSDALAAAHAVGVIHRDVKPANVLLRDRRTDRLHVFLCDFGVAHTETTGLTTAGAIAGTWNYLAPERAAGERGTPASDVYSVGCLLFETLTGRPPYTGADVEVAMAHLQQPVPQLPGSDELTVRVNEVLARSLAKDPAHRYRSAAELRDALRALAGGLTPSSPSQPPRVLAQVIGRGRKRRRRVLGALLAVALVAGGATAALLFRPDAEEPAAGNGGDPTPAPDPSETSTPDPAPEPEPAVTGDLDGDGLGDFATVTYTGGWLLRSDGTTFGPPKPLAQATYPSVVGDVDGDGRLDIVSVEGLPPSLNVTVHLASGTSPSSLLQSPVVDDVLGETVPFVADLDGDGLDDVGLASLGDGRLVVVAARGRASGALGTSRIWFDGDGPTETGDAQLSVGDLTGDGRADLAHMSEAGSGRPRLRLLASTGTALTQKGDSQKITDDARFADFRAGDFDGDGTDELAMTDFGPTVTVWSWTGQRFTSARWIEEDRDEFYTDEVGVADVDGDGDDDLVVLVDQSGVRVLDSTGSRFRVLPGDGRLLAPGKSSEGMLGRIASLY